MISCGHMELVYEYKYQMKSTHEFSLRAMRICVSAVCEANYKYEYEFSNTRTRTRTRAHSAREQVYPQTPQHARAPLQIRTLRVSLAKQLKSATEAKRNETKRFETAWAATGAA